MSHPFESWQEEKRSAWLYRVVAECDLLTVLPRSFIPATGFAEALSCKALPLDLAAIEVSMAWHLRHDNDPAQRWLRARIEEAVPVLLGASVRATGAERTSEAACLRGAPGPTRNPAVLG